MLWLWWAFAGTLANANTSALPAAIKPSLFRVKLTITISRCAW